MNCRCLVLLHHSFRKRSWAPFLLSTLSIFQQQLLLKEDSWKVQKNIYSQFFKAVVLSDVSSNTVLKVKETFHQSCKTGLYLCPVHCAGTTVYMSKYNKVKKYANDWKWDWISRDPFQPQPFHDSVSLSWIKIKDRPRESLAKPYKWQQHLWLLVIEILSLELQTKRLCKVNIIHILSEYLISCILKDISKQIIKRQNTTKAE